MTAVLETLSSITAPQGAANAAQPAARLHGVTKRYKNGVVALDNLSLTLHRGEVVALLGPNGAGKSTAVKLLMGLSAPTSGSVQVFGADPRQSATRLRTGVMLQIGTAPQMLRVREHVEMFRSYYDQPMPFDALVKAAALEGLENRMFGQLSGGQKQRVLFALALAGDPDLVFLDEPTVGLDIEARRAMWAQIRALAAKGKTVLLTTHYLEEADALASRIIVINKGRVTCSGTSAEIKSMGAGLAAGAAQAEIGNDASGAPLASGAIVKLIRCSTTLTSQHLLAMPGVLRVEGLGAHITVTSTQPESTLREMLALDSHLGDLEVLAPALEDAFLALTQQSR